MREVSIDGNILNIGGTKDRTFVVKKDLDKNIFINIC